jgi:hypothetical protein
MSEIKLAPWKMWTIGGAVVASTVLVTALVVGNWNAPSPAPGPPPAPAQTAKVTPPTAPSREASAGTAHQAPRTPSAADVRACNAAAERVASQDKTKDVVTKAVVGALIGAGVGAAGGAIADGGSGAGKGAAIGGIVGGTAGTLYGLSASNGRNPKAKQAYRACLHQRGYAG